MSGNGHSGASPRFYFDGEQLRRAPSTRPTVIRPLAEAGPRRAVDSAAWALLDALQPLRDAGLMKGPAGAAADSLEHALTLESGIRSCPAHPGARGGGEAPPLEASPHFLTRRAARDLTAGDTRFGFAAGGAGL